MTFPMIKRCTLSAPQGVADNMRQAAVLVKPPMPEVAVMLTAGADIIEGLCDAIRAQEILNLELRRIIVELGRFP